MVETSTIFLKRLFPSELTEFVGSGSFFDVVPFSFLRDAMKPINILTGLDYWLDNLMCNVPELVMCYHLEGIVKVSCSVRICVASMPSLLYFSKLNLSLSVWLYYFPNFY